MIDVFKYTIHLADNTLVLAQRNSEWCGHGPVLEQDIALTNISLDLLGQARNLYQYACHWYNEASVEEKQAVEYLIPQTWKEYNRALNEDDLAFLRTERQYLHLLICELPNGDWAQTILRQFFFNAFQCYQYQLIQKSDHPELAAIAEKSLKEISYHLRWSSEWVVRLGDGTTESNHRIKQALKELWPYTGEAFVASPYEIINPKPIQQDWQSRVDQVFAEATLSAPPPLESPQLGGKEGKHTEHLGYLLAEMQYLQRTFPNATW